MQIAEVRAVKSPATLCALCVKLTTRTAKTSFSELQSDVQQLVNDVIVHEQIHRAAHNTRLLDKQFVDALFSFLNRNHVLCNRPERHVAAFVLNMLKINDAAWRLHSS